MSKVVHPTINLAPRGTSATWLRWEHTTDGSLVGGFTRYPVGFTYVELVDSVYRVKTAQIDWSVSGSLTTVPPPSPAQSDTFSVTFSKQIVNTTNELDFPTYANFSFEFTTASTDNAANGATISASPSVFAGINYVTNRAWHYRTGAGVGTDHSGYYYNGLYYPVWRTTFGTAANYPPNTDPTPSEPHSGFGLHCGNGRIPSAGQSEGGGCQGPNNLPFTGSIFGVPVTFYVCSADSLSVSAASFSISAVDFLAYT